MKGHEESALQKSSTANANQAFYGHTNQSLDESSNGSGASFAAPTYQLKSNADQSDSAEDYGYCEENTTYGGSNGAIGQVEVLRPIVNVVNRAKEAGTWDPSAISEVIRKDFKNIKFLLETYGFKGDKDSDDITLMNEFRDALEQAGGDIAVSRSKHLEQGGHMTGRMNEEERSKHLNQKAAQKTLAAGKNVSKGIFGAIGYALGGEEGSHIGAILDTGLSGFKSGLDK